MTSYPRKRSRGALDVIRREDVFHVLDIAAERNSATGHAGKAV